MGPSQICGCPFREPRVFEIAHMVSKNKVPPKSPFWEVKWWPVDHLPVPHPFPIRSSWLYIPLWCDVGILGMVYGIVLPTDNSRCIMDAFPPSDGIPEVLSSRPSMWDLHRHPSCEQNGGRFLVAEHGGCSQVLSQFLGESWGILGIHHVFFVRFMDLDWESCLYVPVWRQLFSVSFLVEKSLPHTISTLPCPHPHWNRTSPAP